VEVKPVFDQTADGNVVYTVELGNAVSSDPNYNGLDVHDVTVTNRNVDVAGIVLESAGAAPLVTTEAGGTAALSVQLATKPANGPVYITLFSNDASEGTTPTVPLVFDQTNWNVPQTAYITGVADGVADGDVAYTVQAKAEAGSSSEYAGMVSGSIGLTNTDHDGPVRTYSSGSNRTIPDNGSITSQINVIGSELIGDLNVSVNIAHGNVGDLRITLIGPNNQSIVLADRLGGSGDNFTGTLFDDESALSITAAGAPFAGTFRPQSGVLAAWDDFSAAGTWTLKVEDLARKNSGSLLNWSLQIREKSPTAPPPLLSESTDTLWAAAVDQLLTEDSNTSKPKRRTLLP
jgi:subtilisin-like proprotein convertase family protein